jgi:hypothetical protein
MVAQQPCIRHVSLALQASQVPLPHVRFDHFGQIWVDPLQDAMQKAATSIIVSPEPSLLSRVNTHRR